MNTIGVEKGLTNVASLLTEKGYSVQIINENMKSDISSLNGFDAIITSDYNSDFLGFSDTETEVPVINASGLTADEVEKIVSREINRKS